MSTNRDDGVGLLVETYVDGAVALLGLSGELTSASRRQLDGAITEVLEAGATHLQIGLLGVTFVDCSGLTSLLAARRRLLTTAVPLQLRRPSACVCRLLELTGTAAAFDIDAHAR